MEGELAKLVEAFPQIKVVNLYVPLKEGNTDLNSAAYALNVWQNDREKNTLKYTICWLKKARLT
ncbi:hypothetical protein QW180_20365 [Vibrio sinaloensis]|nr:hypothetical protein [Vibrio sinaloensis]